MQSSSTFVLEALRVGKLVSVVEVEFGKEGERMDMLAGS
jgi:hypothetical protein